MTGIFGKDFSKLHLSGVSVSDALQRAALIFCPVRFQGLDIANQIKTLENFAQTLIDKTTQPVAQPLSVASLLKSDFEQQLVVYAVCRLDFKKDDPADKFKQEGFERTLRFGNDLLPKPPPAQVGGRRRARTRIAKPTIAKPATRRRRP